MSVSRQIPHSHKVPFGVSLPCAEPNHVTNNFSVWEAPAELGGVRDLLLPAEVPAGSGWRGDAKGETPLNLFWEVACALPRRGTGPLFFSFQCCFFSISPCVLEMCVSVCLCMCVCVCVSVVFLSRPCLSVCQSVHVFACLLVFLPLYLTLSLEEQP